MTEDVLEASFRYAVEAALDAGLYKEFCRLKGYSLPKSGLDTMVDKATGHEAQRMREFISFVRECVWQPWLMQMMAGERPA